MKPIKPKSQHPFEAPAHAMNKASQGKTLQSPPDGEAHESTTEHCPNCGYALKMTKKK